MKLFQGFVFNSASSHVQQFRLTYALLVWIITRHSFTVVIDLQLSLKYLK